jgi:PAS domain S-box-containing protein
VDRAGSSSVVEALKASVFESALSMLMIDTKGVVLAASRPGLQNMGLGRDEVWGRHVTELFPDGHNTAEALRTAGADRGPVTLPLRSVIFPDGSTSWFETQAWPWFDGDGQAGGHLSVIRDVSGEHRALAELRRTESLLDAIVESMPSLLSVVDLTHFITMRVNRAYEEFVGLSRDQVVGGGAPPNFTPEDVAMFRADLERIKHDGGEGHYEQQVHDRHGDLRTLHTCHRVIEDHVGDRHLMILSEDITDWRGAEQTLRSAVAEAESANRAKSAFLATMSHEIRTPLNGVLGMAQAMARDTLSPTQHARLEVIRSSGEALQAILNDVLDLSKVEAGKLEIEQIPFDLRATMRDTVASFSATAAAKGLELSTDLDGGAGVYLGDPARLRQVVSNLLSNALKFTEAGEVRLDVGRRNGQIVIAVSDSGPGLSAGAEGQIFEKFVQADSSTTRRFGGTGLGLAICRELVGLMGGDIRAENRATGGACFTVRLPLQRTESAPLVIPTGTPDNAPPPGLRILAAEDNPVNQKVLGTIFEQAGVSITLVGDGAQALEAFRSQDWDVVLMDVQMPVMDGLNATREIRRMEREAGRPPTPIIGLTANAMAHQKEEYLAIGMNLVVSKPFAIPDLFGAVEDVLRPPPGRRAGAV